MKSLFSKLWKSSKKPSKQRKYRFNAPLHIKRKMMAAHLSKELRTKYNKRSMVVRKGDKVIVMRGNHKGKEGTIEKVMTQKEKVCISGVEVVKKNGTKALYPINVSNVMIKELDLSDKKRKAILERKQEAKKQETAKPSKPAKKENKGN
jgi:large subunit ribosomal protein L24